jgi:hypothetical protein
MAVTFTVESSSAPPVVKLEGVLDEQTSLDALEPHLGAAAVLDLQGLRRINSAGINRWIAFVRRNGQKLTLRACSRVMVDHLNMVLEFKGSARIESFVVPYHCMHCDSDEEVVVNAAAMRKQLASATQPRKCPRCGLASQLDDDPAEYFQFLRFS